jgi:phosphoglycolate phosphatase
MKTPTFRAVLFDFDYTLADSSEGAYECINFALAKMGLALGDHHEPHRCAEFYRLFVERADEVMSDLTVLYESVPAMVQLLRERGLRLGIVSTKYRRRINQVLTREALSDGFELVIGGEDVELHKPHPQGLFEAMQRLECSPESVVYVGDSLVDAELAKRAGVPLIVVLSGTTPRSAFDDYSPLKILETVSELPKFLLDT